MSYDDLSVAADVDLLCYQVRVLFAGVLDVKRYTDRYTMFYVQLHYFTLQFYDKKW